MNVGPGSVVYYICNIYYLFLLFKNNFYVYYFLFLRFFIYLFMRDTERETETQAKGESGSMQEARCGTRSGTLGSRPESKADTQPLSHLGIRPPPFFF